MLTEERGLVGTCADFRLTEKRVGRVCLTRLV